MRPSAIVAEAYASGKIKLFEFLIDATQMPVILQENYGFRYILQKMNFSFQYGEIHTAVLPPFYAQIHLRRCCLCYNYAFDFQFFRQKSNFCLSIYGVFGSIRHRQTSLYDGFFPKMPLSEGMHFKRPSDTPPIPFAYTVMKYHPRGTHE